MRTFRSDNNAGLCPEALQAMIDANDGGHEVGYGDDAYTQRAVEAFRGLFGEDAAVFLVATGTAANTLAIASLTEPWEQVICHGHSHYNDDESTAPERLTHCRVNAVRTASSKITLEDLEQAVSQRRGDVHQPQPGVVTISNTTEFGTVYTPQETHAICRLAHEAGFRVHVDGARFANAVAALDCDPRALSVDAGVDALSFGGTKNGLASGEAVLFFPQGDGEAQRRATSAFPFHRKGTGHLLSKHRFVSAPFAATLKEGVWLRHAGHANAMAARLAAGLAGQGIEPCFPCEANGVFVSLPPPVDAALRAAGHGYYPFGDSSWGVVRLMCSFDTDPGEVDALLADAEAAIVR
ncbi:MAG: threonine aldolase family protein [Planctomycetota bacterium]|jgi:threonine aldolase